MCVHVVEDQEAFTKNFLPLQKCKTHTNGFFSLPPIYHPQFLIDRKRKAEVDEWYRVQWRNYHHCLRTSVPNFSLHLNEKYQSNIYVLNTRYTDLFFASHPSRVVDF